MLSDRDIFAALQAGHIGIDPFDLAQVQPASIDLRVSNEFRTFDNHRYSIVDPQNPPEDLTSQVHASDDSPFVLHPGEFALGSTLERIELGNLHVARLEGRSSLGRIGLVIHATAGFIDPGFEGNITLELSNVGRVPIMLRPGAPIGQVAFFRLHSASSRVYGDPTLGSKYQDQHGTVPARRSNQIGVAPKG